MALKAGVVQVVSQNADGWLWVHCGESAGILKQAEAMKFELSAFL
jgi:ligand-binding sensor domain-containing protein